MKTLNTLESKQPHYWIIKNNIHTDLQKNNSYWKKNVTYKTLGLITIVYGYQRYFFFLKWLSITALGVGVFP